MTGSWGGDYQGRGSKEQTRASTSRREHAWTLGREDYCGISTNSSQPGGPADARSLGPSGKTLACHPRATSGLVLRMMATVPVWATHWRFSKEGIGGGRGRQKYQKARHEYPYQGSERAGRGGPPILPSQDPLDLATS